MKCRRARSLLSPYYDGALGRRVERALTDHLERCAACAAAWADLRGSVDALRAAPPPETTPAHRAAILAAVDAAAREDAEDADVFRRAMDVAGRRAPRERRRLVPLGPVLLGALLGAAAAVAAAAFLAPDGLTGSTGRDARPPRIVSVPRYVDRVEVREVEVPVRVEVPVPVEVPVEVPGPERVVTRGPLVAWDGGAIARALAALASAVEEASHEQAEALAAAAARSDEVVAAAAARERPRPEPARRRPTATRRSVLAPFSASSVVVRNEDGRVRLETRGTLREVVPVLLSHLDGSDPAVTTVVERHLHEIRRSALDDPDLAPRLREPAAAAETWRLFGGDEEDLSWADEWRAWWELNADVVSGGNG